MTKFPATMAKASGPTIERLKISNMLGIIHKTSVATQFSPLQFDPVFTQAESRMLGMQIRGVQRDVGIDLAAYCDKPQVADRVKVIEDGLALGSERKKCCSAECCKNTRYCAD